MVSEEGEDVDARPSLASAECRLYDTLLPASYYVVMEVGQCQVSRRGESGSGDRWACSSNVKADGGREG